MKDFESLAWELHIPGGIGHDRPDRVGASLVLAELTSRGAGSYDSRSLSDAFDSLGIRHSESAGHERFIYRASALKDQLEDVFRLCAAMVCAPQLPEDEIESIRSVLLQELDALKDNPSRRAQIELAARYYPAPFNRAGLGERQGISETRLFDLRAIYERCMKPRGSILSVAGACDPRTVLALAEKYFGSWQGDAPSRIPFASLPPASRSHIQEEAAQLQIALAYPSAPFGSPHYYAAKVALQVLSGGMFGRLFIEVREKRGLVYSVHAGHSGTKEYGTVTGYAGTTPERAHETLEVMVRELGGLKGTVSAEELSRAKVNLKSALILGQEGPGSRAAGNAHDFWLDQRIRPMDEVLRGIDMVDEAAIDTFIEAYPPSPFSLVTLGARDITGSVAR
jgi:predicted Zn-dependent peptidase